MGREGEAVKCVAHCRHVGFNEDGSCSQSFKKTEPGNCNSLYLGTIECVRDSSRNNKNSISICSDLGFLEWSNVTFSLES